MSERGFLNNPMYQAGYQPSVNTQPEKIQVSQEQPIVQVEEKSQAIINKQSELSQLINQLTQQNIKQSTEQTIQPEKVIQPAKQTITKKPKKRGDNKGAK